MRTHDANLGEDRIRGQRFVAEILFLDPDLATRGIEALAAVGCEFIPDPSMVDPCGPTIFGTVVGTSELGEDALWHWLEDIIDPFTGDVVEWGFESADGK